MSKITVNDARKHLSRKADGKVDILNEVLDWGFKLKADPSVNVAALARDTFASTDHIDESQVTFQMESSAALALASKFGTRKAVDAAIDAYNDKAVRPSYKVRTLAEKLGATAKAAPKPSKEAKKLALAVSQGIVTQAQADAIAALKV